MRKIPRLRWYIGGLLFLSTVVNYIDRQTLSVLAPFLKRESGWTNTDYMWIVIAFRVAYSLGQTASGRFLDRTGTRKGLSLTVLWYSLAAAATSLATGLRSLASFRFLLGLGEAANWPGATKAVSEWFPRRESGWAVALFDSGSSIGSALAPFVVLGSYHFFGGWRAAFILTSGLGFAWLLLFRRFYHPPETHPLITDQERTMILADRAPPESSERLSYRALLKLPQTWGYVVAKSLSDPVWFFVTDWFPIFLVAKGFKPEESLVGFWVPFIAADLGNFFGGGVSSLLIQRGWSVGRARRLMSVIGGLGMCTIAAGIYIDSFFWLVACFALSTFTYAAFSTAILNLPADLFPSPWVASASGLGGTGAGVGTIVFTLFIGTISERYSFQPILVGASVISLLAMTAMLTLVRNTAATRRGMVREI